MKKEICINIISIIVGLWLFVSLLSSMIVGLNQNNIDSNVKNRTFTYGCETDMPWTHIFYSELFCQIK